MKRHSMLIIGLALTFLFGLANVSYARRDENCQKTCGCDAAGEAYGNYATRAGCGYSSGCNVRSCPQHIGGCGYPISDKYNDSCSTTDNYCFLFQLSCFQS